MMIGDRTIVDKQEFQRRLLELVRINEEYFNKRPMPENPTVPLTIKEIVRDLRACEYECGANLTDQRSVVIRKEEPFPHWLNQCKNCGRFQHPATGQMVSHRDLHTYYTLFLLDKMRNV